MVSIQSYGFRGEALHSLCTVSTVEITSKRAEDKIAKSIKFNTKCEKIKETSIASTNGTIIKAMNIFENMPVRRNYFKNMKKTKRRFEEDRKYFVVFWIYFSENTN